MIYDIMYLIVNTSGVRSLLVEKFSQLSQMGWSKLKQGQTIVVNIIKPGDSGRYDMILTYIREDVSGASYLKGYIIDNPSNKNYHPAVTDLFFFLPVHPKEYVGKKFDIVKLFPDSFVVNGHIPLTGPMPTTVLDDWDGLTAILDDFFATPDQSQRGGASSEPTTAPKNASATHTVPSPAPAPSASAPTSAFSPTISAAEALAERYYKSLNC